MRSRHIAFAACLVLLSACAPSKGPEQPNGESATAVRPSASESAAEHSDDRELLNALPSTKVSLLQGIALAEQRSAVAISAKFEVEHGKLSLSVYTAKNGLEPDAEHNVLAELSGDPTVPAGPLRGRKRLFHPGSQA